MKLLAINFSLEGFPVCVMADAGLCTEESISNIKQIYFRKAITLEQASLALLLLLWMMASNNLEV